MSMYTHHFYDLDKDSMEVLAPSDLRLIIRQAYDNKQSGMGPGPTMQDVIDHYNDERNYYVIRGVTDDQAIHDALDRLLAYNSSPEGGLPWYLPSMIAGSTQVNPVGRFKLAHGRAVQPLLDKVLSDAGW